MKYIAYAPGVATDRGVCSGALLSVTALLQFAMVVAIVMIQISWKGPIIPPQRLTILPIKLDLKRLHVYTPSSLMKSPRICPGRMGHMAYTMTLPQAVVNRVHPAVCPLPRPNR